MRRLSVLKEESGEESETSSSLSSITTAATAPLFASGATFQNQTKLSCCSSCVKCKCQKRKHHHHHRRKPSSKSREGSHSLELISTKLHGSLDSATRSNNPAKLSRNISDPLCLSASASPAGGSTTRLARSTSRPLVMASTSINSLYSSGTLVALSISDSDIEDIDKDSEEDSSSRSSEGGERPLLSVCESPDCLSGSIYESPLSSFYESPISSPSYYATPMERSPWQSPQSSIKGQSPTGSISSFKITITPSPFPENSSQTSADVFLSVPTPSHGCRRSQSLKSSTARTRHFQSAKAFDYGDGYV